MTPGDVDLVLEGGGVKGLALVGAVAELGRTGHRVQRVAGSSAGAIVGSVVAALARAGEDLTRVEDVARTLDYARFRDRGPVASHLGPLTPLADALSLALDDGVFEGQALEDWVGGVLGDLGVRTFGDLRRHDAGDDGAVESQWSLVVTASDVARRRLLRLPWDYAELGLDPDEQSVAHAVRASAAIPFFFEPVRLTAQGSQAVLVDGGLLSNYPVDLFDRRDGQPPRWPTLGVRLSSREPVPPPGQPVGGPLSLGLAVVATLIEACDARHIDDPCVQARTVFLDTSEVSALDFGLTQQQRDDLIDRGSRAMSRFLGSWDWPHWLATCGPDAPGPRGTAAPAQPTATGGFS
ncbi:MAG: patatin-like phospholipase family protein [Actinomycetes bacterium]